MCVQRGAHFLNLPLDSKTTLHCNIATTLQNKVEVRHDIITNAHRRERSRARSFGGGVLHF